MRRFVIVATLALAGVGLAQAPVPVTRWHNDPQVSLPSGAHRLPEATCLAMSEPLGYHERPGRACYFWLNNWSTYELLVLAFRRVGYEVAHEGLMPRDLGTITYLFRPDRPMMEAVFTFYPADGSVMILAFEEPGPE
jgi:hypothetical protein